MFLRIEIVKSSPHGMVEMVLLEEAENVFLFISTGHVKQMTTLTIAIALRVFPVIPVVDQLITAAAILTKNTSGSTGRSLPGRWTQLCVA